MLCPSEQFVPFQFFKLSRQCNNLFWSPLLSYSTGESTRNCLRQTCVLFQSFASAFDNKTSSPAAFYNDTKMFMRPLQQCTSDCCLFFSFNLILHFFHCFFLYIFIIIISIPALREKRASEETLNNTEENQIKSNRGHLSRQLAGRFHFFRKPEC